MARHLAPFAWRQRMAAIVRRRSFGAVLPLGRHASISGSSLIQCASASMAPPHPGGAKCYPGEEVQGRTRPSTLRRGVGRLIDGYTDGVIERVEFEPRVADLRARIAQLEEHRDALAAASAAQRVLTLVIGRLEDFSIRVRENLDLLDWSARRDVIRLMVRCIEIDDSQVEIVFRIPPPPSGGTGGDRKLKAAQHCPGEHVATFDPDRTQPDALAVVDLDPASQTYSQVLQTVQMPNIGD